MTLIAKLMRSDIAAMQQRLYRALSDNNVRSMATEDLTATFCQIGLDPDRARFLIAWMLNSLGDTTDLLSAERTVFAELGRQQVAGEPMFKVVERMFSGRALKIFEQVARYFEKDQKIIDIGCGDGQVTDLIYRTISRDTFGFDVRYYPAPGVMAPLLKCAAEELRVRDGYFDAALATNVLHHSHDNENTLREMARILKPGGRAVVIETVPVNDDPAELERTFFNDYVYNRCFHNVDVPVPGTYETYSGWVARFQKAGLELDKRALTSNPLHLGYDQPLIRDWHVLYVLRKV